MAENSQRVNRLIAELQDGLGLRDSDAWRSAFVALAVGKGWAKARIARYLGVSRARIGQRIAKYERYAASGDFPLLKEAIQLKPVSQRGSLKEAETYPVAFSRGEWEGLSFAAEMLRRVE